MLRRGPSREPLRRLAGGYLLSAGGGIMPDAPAAHDPLLRLQRDGSHVRVLDVDGCLACHGDESSLLEANRHALRDIETDLSDAVAGPYTSIGADVRVEGTEIEHSIVTDRAQLMFVGSRLEISIAGRGASIVRRFRRCPAPCGCRPATALRWRCPEIAPAAQVRVRLAQLARDAAEVQRARQRPGDARVVEVGMRGDARRDVGVLESISTPTTSTPASANAIVSGSPT